jgi:CRISPR-associated protein Cmr3
MPDLILAPRDGLFLKDGREWATAEEGRAHSLGWPMPSTLHGAFVTACGRLEETADKALAPEDWLSLAEAIRLGPSVALRRPMEATAQDWRQADRVWPVPTDAFFVADEAGNPRQVRRLEPLSTRIASLGRDDDIAREALWRPRFEDQVKPARSAPIWWAEEAFVKWLADPALERICDRAYRGLALPRHVQSHVGIDPATLTARDEILFAHDVVEMLDDEGGEWAIGCRLLAPENIPNAVTLGGDRRRALVTSAAPDLFGFPAVLGAAFESHSPKGLRLVTVTPAVFAQGWLPNVFAAGRDNCYRGRLPGIDAELILRAAIVPRAAHVSGWDMARRRPKPTARLVPLGAVYYLVRADGKDFTAENAASLWLCGLGKRIEQGFGYCVPGVWHPEERRR